MALNRLRVAAGRVPAWIWALLFALALTLPRLGAFGFWDPWELKLAEQARDVSRSGHLLDSTDAGHYPPGRPLGPVLEAIGIRIFGATELGARLPIALAAIVALMAVFWAGAGLLRRRAALLATLALGTMPLFVLEARQLTSDAPLIAALALSLGGLGRFAWPATGQRRARDLAIGLGALAAGAYAGGVLLGVALPVLALTAALVIGYGLVPGDAPADDGTAPLAAPGVGRDIVAGRPFGASTLKPGAGAFVVFAGLGAIGVALLVRALTHVVTGKYSVLFGGVPRAGAPTHTFEALVRELGFGLFPWSAVAVFALARPLIRLDAAGGEGAGGDARTNPRLAFVELLLLCTAGVGFALSSYLDILIGDARYVALPAIALAIGAFLDEALEGVRPEPVAGLLMATGTMIVARDFFQEPAELPSVNLADKVRWPPQITIGGFVLVVGLVAALGVYAGLAARSRALGRIAGAAPTGAGRIRRAFDRLFIAGGRFGLQLAVVCAMVFAFVLAQGVVPMLSAHLSFKPVLESYTKFARAGEKIGKYHVEGHGSSFYSKQTLIDLHTQEQVLSFLRDHERVFVMIAADELAAIDLACRQAELPYFVVDASSSRFLLLTNQLGAGQRDDNPLTKNVWMTPPGVDPARAKPPWDWRVPLAATFGDAIDLVGANFPASLRRPGHLPIELFFRVKTRPPGVYKIFVHVDGPAQPRLIGDHDPVGHSFATSFWLPGEYIRDHYDIEVPLMTTPAGSYAVYVGFWPGGEGKRLKITAGPNDGADRVHIGTIEIK